MTTRSTGSARSACGRRAGDRARLRPRARRPTWRTSCSRASASCASAASAECDSARAPAAAARGRPRRRRGDETPAGDVREIRARSTLLATGGFGGDPELRAEHIHPQARDLPLRANRTAPATACGSARSAGAAFGAPNAGFYGHLIPSGRVHEPVRVHRPDLLPLRARRAAEPRGAPLLRRDDRRPPQPLHLVEQPEARALLIYDQHVHDHWMMRPYVEGVEPVDKFQLAYRRGARCAVAEDLEEFAELPDEWGYPGPAVLQSLRDFNGQCEAGPGAGRTNDARPLTEPPYYVIEVVPAITFSFGGPADRSPSACARRGRDADPRPAGRRSGHRRSLRPRLRGWTRQRARVRPAGGGDGTRVVARRGLRSPSRGTANLSRRRLSAARHLVHRRTTSTPRADGAQSGEQTERN